MLQLVKIYDWEALALKSYYLFGGIVIMYRLLVITGNLNRLTTSDGLTILTLLAALALAFYARIAHAVLRASNRRTGRVFERDLLTRFLGHHVVDLCFIVTYIALLITIPFI